MGLVEKDTFIMWPSLISGITGIFSKVLDKIPDGNLRKEIEKELNEQTFILIQSELAGQVDLNKIDAEKGDWFRSYWRPAAGWICVLGLAYTFLFQPFVAMIAVMWIPSMVIPAVDSGSLMTLLLALLGISGLRTTERLKGKA
jgi:hypothetical protein